MNPLSELLHGHDRWDGAACLGHWDLFDPRAEGESEHQFFDRVSIAQAICNRCPLLESCHATAHRMPATHRSGTWAGIPYDSNGRPRRTRNASKEKK